jgi:hypothetical protein
MKRPAHPSKVKRSRRVKINAIEQNRWAAYATAVLASSFTFGPAQSAEAGIHYSGPINQELEGNESLKLPLGDAGMIVFEHVKHYTGTTYNNPFGGLFRPHSRIAPNAIRTSSYHYNDGSALFGISAPSGAVRGGLFPDGEVSVSRLIKQDLISGGAFFPGVGFLVQASYRTQATYLDRGQFLSAGVGAIGFKFNTGAGDQYGWARVRMDGFPYHTFRVLDYAYGDPGDVVVVGRPPRGSESAPVLESLGGLALGAIGLLAWRRRRGNNRTDV